MKKTILISILIMILLALSVLANGADFEGNVPGNNIEEETAKTYCISLGYTYHDRNCIFQDGTMCNAIEFYQGTCQAPHLEDFEEEATGIIDEEEPEIIDVEEEEITEAGETVVVRRIMQVQVLSQSQIRNIRPKFQFQNQELVREEIKVNIESEKEEIEEPTEVHRFVIDKGCQVSFAHYVIDEISGTTIQVIDVPNYQIREMAKDDCIKKFGDDSSIKRFTEYTQERLQEEFIEDAKELKLDKTRGVEDIGEIQEVVEEEVKELIQENVIEPDIGKISDYQYFVTPEEPTIKTIAFGKSPSAIYDYIAKTVWISDKELFGIKEKWTLPTEFLFSLELPENPTGQLASDCSEKANTLVSLLRSSGVSSANVRVVLGMVDFGGSIGGHAWAEYYDGKQWIALEPSSGPYFDDITNQVIERENLPFDYFALYEYPIVDVYYRYNDKYFEDLTKGESNAPDNWGEFATTRLEGNIAEGFEEKEDIMFLLYLAIFVAIGYYLAKIKIK